MSEQVKLDSASAVEVAAFCWPARNWRGYDDGYPMARAVVERGLSGTVIIGFDPRSWDDLHRAAAVLVKRGLAEGLNRNLIGKWDRTRDAGPHTNDFMAWLLSAPADAWARAILATVREVSK